MPDPRSVVPGSKVRHGFRDPAYREALGEDHHGIDVEGPPGSPVLAPAPGVVVYAGEDNSPGGAGGIGVKVRTARGLDYSAWHLSAANVKVGDRVSAGQQLGALGQTGNARYPHVHFQAQVSHSGAYVDPDSILSPASRALAGTSDEVSQMEDPTQNTPIAPGAARDAATLTRRNDAAVKQLEQEHARLQSQLRPAQQRLEALMERAQEADSQGQPTPAAKKAAGEVTSQQRTVNQLNNRLTTVSKTMASLLKDPTGSRAAQASPTAALEEVTDPNTGLVVGLRDRATGRTIRVATPRQPAAPRGPTTVNTSANEPYIVTRQPDGSLSQEPNPNYVAPRPKRSTHVAGGRAYTLDDGGDLVNTVDLPRIPEQLQIIQDADRTISELRGMYERGEIELGKMDAMMDATRAAADAALKGTTPFQLAKQEDDARRARQQMGVNLVEQRIQSGGALASGLMSSAASLAQRAMFRPGQTSLNFDPLADAMAYMQQTNQAAQTDPVTAALLQGAKTMPTQPVLPPGAPAGI